jgi:S-adenosylmethionine-diacylglycerol 3-amino-3-carboxypropyl transferase
MIAHPSLTSRLTARAHDLIFRQVHSRRLVFNACWEDPRIDRTLLGLNQQSRVPAITSAGCNVLDYLPACTWPRCYELRSFPRTSW